MIAGCNLPFPKWKKVYKKQFALSIVTLHYAVNPFQHFFKNKEKTPSGSGAMF